MKVSLILVLVSMMVTLDTSDASCDQSLIASCLSTFQSSIYPTISIPEACRIMDIYLDCLRPCGNPDLLRSIASKGLAQNGITCGESKTAIPDSGVVVSSTTQVIEHKDMAYSCEPSLITDCLHSMQSSLRNIRTHSQACRVMDSYLYCVRSCGNPDKLKKEAYERLSRYGIECGSAMVTLSGTMVILMLFSTLRNFF